MVRPAQRVQDDLREQQLALMLRLERSPSRIGSDATDEHGNTYELKTVTTSGVTTGRDVGLPFLDRLRHTYQVVAKGRQDGYGFTIEDIYFLSPEKLDAWIRPIESRIRRDQDLVDRAIHALQSIGFPGDSTRLRALCARGLTINNPKIGWNYVQSHGIRLQEPTALHLRQVVAAHPLTGLGPS